MLSQITAIRLDPAFFRARFQIGLPLTGFYTTDRDVALIVMRYRGYRWTAWDF